MSSQMGYGIPRPNDGDITLDEPVDVNVVGGGGAVDQGAGGTDPWLIEGEVGLDSNTLAALEETSVTNMPTDFPDADAQTILTAIQALLAGTLTVDGLVTVDQGAAGADPWPVDIQGGTVSVSNLQQLAVSVDLAVVGHDLDVAAYNAVVPYTNDSLLGTLTLRFTTAVPRSITVTRSDGSVLYATTENTDLRLDLDFEDDEINAGQTLTVNVGTTTSACLLDVTLTSKIGTSALGGNPVLGPSDDVIGTVRITTSNTPAGDAFSRLRVSEPFSLFEVSHEYDLAPNRMDQWGAGSIAHEAPHAVLTVGSSLNDLYRHQTHRYLHYQPGKSQLVKATGLFSQTVLSGWGYHDDDDGPGTMYDPVSGDLSLYVRSSLIGDQIEVQGGWNEDNLDGTGPSGLTIDTTKSQHLILDLQWLAVGVVRIGFEFNGQPVYAHRFDFTNTLTNGAYMRTGSLPVRWWIENTVGGAGHTMKAICCAVISEGGHDPIGFAHAYARSTSVVVGGARVPLLSLRPALLYGGVTNRAHTIPIDFSTLSTGSILIEVIQNGTLTGASFAIHDTNSHTELDTAASAITGGHVLTTGYASASGSSATGVAKDIDSKNIVLCLDAPGTTADIVTVAATKLGSGTSPDVHAGLRWLEVR